MGAESVQAQGEWAVCAKRRSRDEIVYRGGRGKRRATNRSKTSRVGNTSLPGRIGRIGMASPLGDCGVLR